MDNGIVTDIIGNATLVTFRSRSGMSPIITTTVRRSTLAEIKHGTEWGWRRCSKGENGACDLCREAKQAAWDEDRKLRLNKPIPEDLEHGAYVRRNYGCECDICVEDDRAKRRIRDARYRERKRKEVSGT